MRARRLYTNGIADPEALRAAGRDEVARILGRGIADQVFAQLEGAGEQMSDETTGARQASLHQFG